jgi:hypothetical protein
MTMFATIEFLGRDRDKERLREAEQIRLLKTMAKGKPVRFNGWGVRSLLVAIFVLSLAAVPAMANSAPVEPELFGAGYHQTLAPCANYEDIGVLGREGGLLGLLGVGGHRDPISAAIVTGEAYSVRAVQNGSASYAIYVRTECLGQEGGLLFSKNR